MKGISTPRRIDFYLKYKKSGIFDDEDPLSDKSQNITLKVNKGKCTCEFKPNYNEYEARDKYLKDYWNVDVKKNSQNLKSTKNKEEKPYNAQYTNYNQCKTNGNESKNGFSVRRQYIKEFLTNNIFEESKSEVKNNSMKLNRSKSFFQPRTKTEVVLEGDAHCGRARFQKIESLASNVFNVKEKERIVWKKDRQIPSESTGESISLPMKTEKSKIPSVFDWRYNNIELSSKSHLIRSKTIDPFLRKQQDLISHFEEDDKKTKMINSRNRLNIDNKNMFIPVYATKSIDIRPNRNLIHRFPDDKEVELYELSTKENFIKVDCKTIKKMFLSNGIHMYAFEEDGSTVDGFQKGKISFRIRKDKNDHDTTKKMKQLKEEMKSMGLKMDQIVKVANIKKERKQTPGIELLKKTKQKNVPAKE